jgi:DNA-binding SARP family transcriptional activator
MSAITRLELMGGFGLRCDGGYVDLPWNAQRLLAFLALRRRTLRRVTVGAALWLDGTDERAAANLRTALWRVRAVAGEIIEVSGASMRLVDSVAVDLHELIDSSRCLLRGDAAQFSVMDVDLFGAELLPDWDEEWLQLERERIKQLRMHALEKLCTLLVSLGRFGEAIEAGLAAVEAEPLRESAQRVVIEAHMAEGNRCEAIRRLRLYEELLIGSLGLGPSMQLRSLVAD